MDKKIIIDKLVKIAEAQIGVKEEGGNNKGASIVLFQQATWLKPAPWPWCAAFVCWCIQQWLKDKDVKAHLNLTDEKIKTWRPRTAGAFDFVNWAKTNRLKVFDEKLDAKAGDIVVFDFSHIAIVSADQVSRDTITTIEGNTNVKGERDSHSGDGVWRKTRNENLVRAYIRIIE